MSRFEVIHIFHIIRNVIICIFEGKRKDVCIWNTETVSGFRSRKGIILLRRNEFYVGFYSIKCKFFANIQIIYLTPSKSAHIYLYRTFFAIMALLFFAITSPFCSFRTVCIYTNTFISRFCFCPSFHESFESVFMRLHKSI